MKKIINSLRDLMYPDFYVTFLLGILASFHIFYGLVYNLFWLFLITIFFLSVYCKKFHADNLLILFYFLLGWSAVGLLYTNDISYSVGYVLKIFIFIFSLNVVSKVSYLENTLFIIKVACLLYIVAELLELVSPDLIARLRESFVSDINDIDRIDMAVEMRSTKYGLFADSAVSAFFCATGTAIGFSYFFSKKKWLSIPWLAASLTGVMLTTKRGAILSIVATVYLLYLMFSKNISVFFFRVIKGLIVLLTAVLIIMNTDIIYYIESLNNVYSNYNRVELYTIQLEGIKNSPLVGNGTKSTRKDLRGTEGHNIFIAKTNENGIIGVCLLLAVFSLGVLKTRKVFLMSLKTHELSAILLFSLFMQIFFICYGFTENTTTNIYSQAMYFFCMSACFKAEQYLTESQPMETTVPELSA